MLNTIEYIFPKEQAKENIKIFLQEHNIAIIKESEVNNGYGYKYNCIKNEKFSFILYFKSDYSSKIVFENTTPETLNIFDKLIEKNLNSSPIELYDYPSIPISVSFEIKNPANQEKIHEIIHKSFDIVEDSQPKSTILYKATISKSKNKFTLTQFNNGTLLAQGLDSPLFTEIMEIIQSINPLSEKEHTLMYVPENEQAEVKIAINQIPEMFSSLYEDAQRRLTADAFAYLFENDRQTLVSAVGILKLAKETDLKIPLYNPILYPFAKVFEGFILKILIDKCFFTLQEYRNDHNIAKIGNCLREKKLKKYIKDTSRDESVLDKLFVTWDSLRNHELHADPAQNADIRNLNDIKQVENRIGEISAAIMDGYRVLVQHGYSEAEMLSLKADTSAEDTNKKKTNLSFPFLKEIPTYYSHIGTDESGKGDYFGPLVIAGIFVDREDEQKLMALGIQDSKKNSDQKNRELSQQIQRVINKEKISIIYIMPEKYNKLYEKIKNLNTLLAWGHARAIENILSNNSCENVIADQFGDESFINKALLEKGKQINLFQTSKAERDIGVAAASILARDKYLEQLLNLQRTVGFELYKGASFQVEEAAKRLVKKFGQEELKKYAKLHFKTTERIFL